MTAIGKPKIDTRPILMDEAECDEKGIQSTHGKGTGR